MLLCMFGISVVEMEMGVASDRKKNVLLKCHIFHTNCWSKFHLVDTVNVLNGMYFELGEGRGV